MTKARIRTGARIAVLAVAAGGAMALSACEEHAYPSAAPREGTAAAPTGDEALAGAPSGYAPPSTRSPAYVPPPGAAAPPYGPPPGQPGYPPQNGYAQNGYPPNGYPPPPPANTYPPGYGHQNASGAPPVIVSMAPIPNPPERPRGEREAWRHRHHPHHAWMQAYGPPHYAPAPYAHHHHHHRAVMAVPMAPRRHAAAPVHARPVHAHPAAPTRPAPAPSAQLTKPAAPDHHKHHRHAAATAAATAAAASGGPTNTTSNTVASGSEADRYQALEKALRDAFAQGAQLQAPAHMEANQAADVTLTVPGDFAQTFQSEAGKEGLASALASVNLTATLSGDGYTIVPADPQTLPMTQGQATVFHWKATPTGAGHGPLTAAVKATAPGDNHTVDLGSKSTGTGSASGRVLGIGILAVVALALLGWAAQRRRPAKPTGAVKPRASHTNGPSNP
jgi:hypothetical protein